MSEQIIANLPVYVQALWDRHAKPRQHHGDEATRACSVHEIEIMAWEEFVFVKGLPCRARDRSIFVLHSFFAFGDLVHEVFEDE